MRLLKFCKYFYYIKLYFNKLPKDIQDELIDDIEKYYNLARIAKWVN